MISSSFPFQPFYSSTPFDLTTETHLITGFEIRRERNKKKNKCESNNFDCVGVWMWTEMEEERITENYWLGVCNEAGRMENSLKNKNDRRLVVTRMSSQRNRWMTTNEHRRPFFNTRTTESQNCGGWRWKWDLRRSVSLITGFVVGTRSPLTQAGKKFWGNLENFQINYGRSWDFLIFRFFSWKKFDENFELNFWIILKLFLSPQLFKIPCGDIFFD